MVFASAESLEKLVEDSTLDEASGQIYNQLSHRRFTVSNERTFKITSDFANPEFLILIHDTFNSLNH
jgi:hypothetical protein